MSHNHPNNSNQGLIQYLPIGSVHPAPENDEVYRPINPSDPEFRALVMSVKEDGIQEPLIISADGFIISGHRRYAAAVIADLTIIPCIIRADVSHSKDLDGFLKLLRECNRQRNKTFDEKLREEVISAKPEQAYQELCEYCRR